MRISQQTELVVAAVLIAYVAFTPGLQVVRQFLSTSVGKAVGLAAVVALWKYVSPLLALLVVVTIVHCTAMREYADDPSIQPAVSGPPPNTHCPSDYTFDSGQCKNKATGQTIPATVCLTGQTWDGTKCSGSSSASTPPPTVTPPPSTSSTETKQPFSNMTPAPVPGGGVQPDIKDKENFAPF